MAVLPVAAGLAMAGLTVATAHADPAPDASSQPSCAFTLTPPSVVNVSGTQMVTATLTPGPCTGNITINGWTVCIELKDSEVKSQCNFHPWWDPVQIYFAPYRAGGTYVATGRACGDVAPDFGQSCMSFGPNSKTL